MAKINTFQKETAFARCFFLALLFSAKPLLSRSMIESTNSLEIDWGRLKIRFIGESFAGSPESSYDKQVADAITTAILENRQKVINYHKSYLISQNVDEKTAEASAVSAADAVATSTYPYHTEYFPDGVKVYLENSLTKALYRSDLSFKVKEDEASTPQQEKFSGIVLRVKGKIKPRADYTIIDETNKVLFQASDIKKNAYEKNLMGRWLTRPTREELNTAVGAQPLSIAFEEDAKGQFKVQGQAWHQIVAEGQALLRNAKIAIVSGE